MATFAQEDITELLQAWSEGDSSALERLVPVVYDELHRLAHRYISREQPGHVLQTTALVNEAYLRLVETGRRHWRNRAHFFAISAKVMRRILVDFARSRDSQKRGGRVRQVSLNEARLLSNEKDFDLVALNDALDELASRDERMSKVVELRFFGGLTSEETAEVLRVSPNTVLLDWSLAKAWLCRKLRTK